MHFTVTRRKAQKAKGLLLQSVGGFREKAQYVLRDINGNEMALIKYNTKLMRSCSSQITIASDKFEIVEHNGTLSLNQENATIISDISKGRIDRGGNTEFTYSEHTLQLYLQSLSIEKYRLLRDKKEIAVLKRRFRKWKIDARNEVPIILIAFCFVLARCMSMADGE